MIKRGLNRIRVLVKNTYYSIFIKDLRIGKNFNHRKGLIINCKKYAKLKIGNNVFLNNYCTINVHKKVIIGDDCIFGEGVKIYDHNHRFSDKKSLIREQGYNCKNIVIGNNCWIGSNVILLSGTIIGDNTIIGAGCIISSEIPSDSIVRNINNYTYEKRRE